MITLKNTIKISMGACGSIGVIELWREKEKARIRELTERFAQFGMIKLQGSSSRLKAIAWESYLPHLLETWAVASKSLFKIDDQQTWPDIPNGRALEYAHRSHSHYPIRLWQDHYEAQAVVTCFIDNGLDGAVHWGETTHWKLKLLISAPWDFIKISHNRDNYNNGSIKDEIQLEGSENAWGIVNFPIKAMKKKKDIKNDCHDKLESENMITPNHAHIDGGRRGVFSKGLPFPKPVIGVKQKDVDVALMQLLAAQTVIQLYCTTPGDLGKAQGTTGLYESSHLILSAALAKLYRKYDYIPWSDVVAVMKSLTTPSSNKSEREESEVNFLMQKETMNKESHILNGLLRQFDLKEEETMLMMGTCIHGSMFASEPMKTRDGIELPRVIMNAKSFVGGSFEDTESGVNAELLVNFTTSRPHSSPANMAMLKPQTLWVDSGKPAEEFEMRVQRLCEAFEGRIATSQSVLASPKS